jgi:ketosteroid isomerase-like protein
MSEQSNTALVDKVYDAFNRGDMPTILANVDPNAEWINNGPASVPYYGNFSGRIGEFFQAIGDDVTDGSVIIEQYIASGDTVVARGRWRATVRSTGAKIDADVVHFFIVSGDKITSWKGYGDTAADLAAHTAKAASA